MTTNRGCDKQELPAKQGESATVDVSDLFKYEQLANMKLESDPIFKKVLNITKNLKASGLDDEVLELRTVLDMFEKRQIYLEKYCSAESSALQRIRRDTMSYDWNKAKQEGAISLPKTPSMVIGKVTGEFLKFMVSMQQAKRVLDIGMFTGYSALAMAEAVPPDGVVVTCDVEPYLESFCRRMFDKSPHGKKIDIRIGNAALTLHQLVAEGQKFDFIFIDADKEAYCKYYTIIMDTQLLSEGGTMLFDNALTSGVAYSWLDINTPADLLNKMVDNDPRVRNVLLSVRDGILMIRRKTEVTPCLCALKKKEDMSI